MCILLEECRLSTYQHDAPFQNPPGESEEVEVTDPTHPLFGRRFRVESISHPPHRPGHVTVAYREGMRLRLPVVATNLTPGSVTLPRTKLTRDALRDLLSVLKECESSCPDPRSVSGASSPTI
jgi:hypothetical protein